MSEAMINENLYDFKLDLSNIALITVSLPLIALAKITTYSLSVHYLAITQVSWGVNNFIPTISAMTGIKPEVYIWRFAIGLHLFPRLMIAQLYYKAYQAMNPKINRLNAFIVFLNYLDVLSLVGTAFVSNSENPCLHERLFMIFLFSTLAYMICSVMRDRYLMQRGLLSEQVGPFHKLNFVLVHGFPSIQENLFDILCALCSWHNLVYHSTSYLSHSKRYAIHNYMAKQCLAFSWFALAELGFAFANMGFHMSASVDFADISIVLKQNKQLMLNSREKSD
ncbi:Post-GPI attachment to proteins factor 2 [Cichlidogyrus casuarinus]|uniref:Post-GPI attachment to proteins factor 2 n=1 Tax=Cichlidogyrus casuarinus TaxID=1844966 RepID=A0ABD2QNC0_9PLAT